MYFVERAGISGFLQAGRNGGCVMLKGEMVIELTDTEGMRRKFRRRT